MAQPISALNIYFFIECYQKEILSFLENNNCFSLRYHRKNNDLFYKRKTNKLTEYFAKTSHKIDKSVLQQTGAYFKIHKFNSVSSFTNSRLLIINLVLIVYILIHTSGLLNAIQLILNLLRIATFLLLLIEFFKT